MINIFHFLIFLGRLKTTVSLANSNSLTSISYLDLNLSITLKIKFPDIESSPKEDICYATTNRQNAIKKYAKNCDKFIVVGSKNSSNSNRLVEVAAKSGCPDSTLLDSKDDLKLELYDEAGIIGISSGASVPENLVFDVIERFKSRYDIEVKEFELARETVVFNLPKNMRK